MTTVERQVTVRATTTGTILKKKIGQVFSEDIIEYEDGGDGRTERRAGYGGVAGDGSLTSSTHHK